MKTLRSKCCHYPVTTKGMPDFMGDDQVVTVSYFCCSCLKPCDVVEEVITYK